MAERLSREIVADKALDYRNPRLSNVYITGAAGMYDYVNIGIA